MKGLHYHLRGTLGSSEWLEPRVVCGAMKMGLKTSLLFIFHMRLLKPKDKGRLKVNGWEKYTRKLLLLDKMDFLAKMIVTL